MKNTRTLVDIVLNIRTGKRVVMDDVKDILDLFRSVVPDEKRWIGQTEFEDGFNICRSEILNSINGLEWE